MLFRVLAITGVAVSIVPAHTLAQTNPTAIIQVGKDVRTITEAITSNPRPGTVIQLSAGTYSTDAGEIFPLRLPAGVILRGNPATKGAGIIISGGGRFISPTFADQNAAIIPSRGARIEGITIQNRNPRGYGIWIESQPDVHISHNSFTANTHDGVFLAGTAVAWISDNHFVGNTGSGLSAVGSSSGEIRNNLFENTGFGLSIGQKSQVKLVANRIVNNVDGVIITNEAVPVFRHNIIEGSHRDGLVVIADRDKTPRPDLGTIDSNGSNIFRHNRLHDIHNLAPVMISAVGNQLNPSRVKGRVDFYNTPNATPTNPGLRFPESLRKPKAEILPPPSNRLPSPVVQNPTKTIIIDRESRPVAIPPVRPPVSAIDPRTGQPLRFRVLVPVNGDTDLARIRTIVPDAFRSVREGRTVVQIGAYSDRADAEAQAQRIAPLGMQAVITNF